MPRCKAAVGLAVLAAFAPLTAQSPASAPPIFSGLLFGNYSYQLPTSSAPFPNQDNNAFVLDRAYPDLSHAGWRARQRPETW